MNLFGTTLYHKGAIVNLYNEDYYERGIELGISGYSNYRWIPELTLPLAFRLIEHLKISEQSKILDYGCAKGYLVKALRLLHRDAYGYDISEYAVENCPHEIQKYINPDLESYYFDWIICKDVLEHVPYETMNDVLQHMLSMADRFFIVVPLGEDGKYVVPAYEHDNTHVIREPMSWWVDTFEKNGFVVMSKSYLVKNIKENYAQHKKGNGFFILQKKSTI
jgi:SAM-dependent methyltransferase